MNIQDEMEYLKLSKGKKFLFRLLSFFKAIPKKIGNGFLGIGRFFKNFFLGIGRGCKDIVTTFVNGDWKTKISYVIMGFGNITRGQILRGVLFLLFELVFLYYMIFGGGAYYLRMLGSLGLQGPTKT